MQRGAGQRTEVEASARQRIRRTAAPGGSSSPQRRVLSGGQRCKVERCNVQENDRTPQRERSRHGALMWEAGMQERDTAPAFRQLTQIRGPRVRVGSPRAGWPRVRAAWCRRVSGTDEPYPRATICWNFTPLATR